MAVPETEVRRQTERVRVVCGSVKLSTVGVFKNMRTDDSRFIHLEGELLRRYQLAVLRIAEDIIAVCEKEQVRYHLGGGSCLGAVRHGGFIPWDDDMDVNMLADDYPRFREAFLRTYGEKYAVCDERTPGYMVSSVQIRLRGSVARGRNDPDGGEMGFSVDIFLMENVFDNKLLRTLHGVLCMGAGFALSCRAFYSNRALMRALAAENPEARGVFRLKIGLGRLLSFLPADAWMRATVRCYGLCRNGQSKYVSFPSGRGHYFKETYPRENMVNTVRMPFEGHQWCVPEDYDGYLRNLYGPDYMTPPSGAEQESHILLELKFPDGT